MGSCPVCGSGDAAACTRPYCPLRIRNLAFERMKPLVGLDHYQGPAPAPFVGHAGYPYVHAGLLATPMPMVRPEELDAPGVWAQQNLGIARLVTMRSGLINARFKVMTNASNRQTAILQEVSMASRPPDVEVTLSGKPSVALWSDGFSPPRGPFGQAEVIRLTENPRVPSIVEKVVADTDCKATLAAFALFRSGIDEHRICKLLSVGLLGTRMSRRLVPTRWAITASDDLLGKQLMEGIADMKESDFLAYAGGYLGNYYVMLMFPGPWGFELYETMVEQNKRKRPGEMQSWTDYEGPRGRTAYASNTMGGYYACRLAVLEKLAGMKQRAQVLALRFVTEEYSMPLGVWVVREASRKALSGKPIRFADSRLMVEYARVWIQKRFGLDASFLFSKSRLLSARKNQKRLSEYTNG